MIPRDRPLIRCGCGWEGLTVVGLRAHVEASHPLSPVQIPNGHARGRRLGRRGLLRRGFWATHHAELGAIVRGEMQIVTTPVGTYHKMHRMEAVA